MPEETSEGLDAGGAGELVLEDGLAFVQKGEVVLARAGSEAQAEQVLDDARAVVHFHFPVEIEVRAAPDPVDPELIADRTLLGLVRGIANS